MKKVISSLTIGSLLMNPVGHGTSQLSHAWGIKGQFGVDGLTAQNLMKQKCANSKVVVAVIDTGLDVSHPSLKNSLWVNEVEKNGRPGVDDDRNGFVDDVNGWDFVTRSGKIVDRHGHGTHIAGIIAAAPSREDDFSGVCPGVKIMSLRYYDPNASGDDNLDYTIRGIDYAVKMGVDIINYSGGGNSFSAKEHKALKEAEKKGILVVAAAGNEANFSDQKPYYPASYSDLKNIVSVAAINEQGLKLPRSNFGIKNVHIAAPGQSILSTLPGGSFGFHTGTSQATAFVSGIAAQLLVEGGTRIGDTLEARTQTVKKIILDSALKTEALKGKTQTSGYSSAVAALETLQSQFLGIQKAQPSQAVKRTALQTRQEKMTSRSTRRVSDQDSSAESPYLMQLKISPFENTKN